MECVWLTLKASLDRQEPSRGFYGIRQCCISTMLFIAHHHQEGEEQYSHLTCIRLDLTTCYFIRREM